MPRRPLIAGNWKMHLSVAQAVELAEKVAEVAAGCNDRDVVIAPPFTALDAVSKAVGKTSTFIASQNVAWEKEGAFTGEISPTMLVDLGVPMAIIGHSERRQIFQESDKMVNLRVKGALANGIVPILCIGETLGQREADMTFKVLESQLAEGLEGCTSEMVGDIVVAYEPVWAIGTGKTASKEQAQEVHAYLRQFLEEKYRKDIAQKIRILYGGSVKPDNVDSLMAQPDIDGALVGGAALKFESFARIINFI
ncbi:triose-phosphate isomerase [Desulfogranum marinum]|uniref:triose-phosphate isomerase n=1 Tax=Desulfogranum marinum TaxID=453220 RepID=UPI001965EF05|nr:triose-phosphate isomerase [Desulfogranum marinum]MBM9513600.1 triose-phosphate isomerase [Desulfogranum marinum]